MFKVGDIVEHEVGTGEVLDVDLLYRRCYVLFDFNRSCWCDIRSLTHFDINELIG